MSSVNSNNEKFIAALKKCKKKSLCKTVDIIDITKEAEVISFAREVENVVNNYSLDRKGIVERILSESALANSFAIIACHWVEAMSSLYRPDYWDERDKLAIEKCYRFSLIPEFQTLFAKYCCQKYNEQVVKAKTLSLVIVESLLKIHHTLRQSFTGIVLTFLMQFKPASVLANVALESGVVYERDVRFPLI